MLQSLLDPDVKDLFFKRSMRNLWYRVAFALSDPTRVPSTRETSLRLNRDRDLFPNSLRVARILILFAKMREMSS